MCVSHAYVSGPRLAQAMPSFQSKKTKALLRGNNAIATLNKLWQKNLLDCKPEYTESEHRMAEQSPEPELPQDDGTAGHRLEVRTFHSMFCWLWFCGFFVAICIVFRESGDAPVCVWRH